MDRLVAELDREEDRVYLAVGSAQIQPAPPTPAAPAPPGQSLPVMAPGGAPAQEAAEPYADDFDEAEAAAPEPVNEPSRSTKQSSPCEEACQALASMDRAAHRICHITGDADARCTRAQDRVAVAAQRVAAAGCGCGEG